MENPRDSETQPQYSIGGQWPTGARLPIPGNAEWVLWALVALLIAIVAGISDRVDAPQWVEFMKWTTAAYLISRGIAKASRVLEQ
jgi:hypothetical protein